MPRSLPTALALVVLLAAAPLNAQDVFPNRPITIVNPFPPGGQVDIAGRPLAAAMERILEQPVVLVNKPGAAGSSPEYVERSATRPTLALRSTRPRA